MAWSGTDIVNAASLGDVRWVSFVAIVQLLHEKKQSQMEARPWQRRVSALDQIRSQHVLEDRGTRGSGESLQDAGGEVDGDGRCKMAVRRPLLREMAAGETKGGGAPWGCMQQRAQA